MYWPFYGYDHLVDHELLLRKLEKFGRGNVDVWLTSYLSNRTKVVDVSGTMSGTLDIGCGISQRSVLYPLLFILFLNDMPDVVDDGGLTTFADDMNYLCEKQRS